PWEKPDVLQSGRCIAQQTAAPCQATMEALHDLRLDSRRFVRLPLHRLNGANGMSDIEGKVTRAGASERGQRRSFKIVCCNFCKGLFLKAGWRWVDRNSRKNFVTCNRRRISQYTLCPV